MNKTPDNLNDYRWYTCYEDKIHFFVCSQTTPEKALQGTSYPLHPQRIAVPVHKYVPSFFDSVFIWHNLRKEFIITKE